MENELIIQNFQSEDLRKEFNCSVRNSRGFQTRRAQLRDEGEASGSRAFRPVPVW